MLYKFHFYHNSVTINNFHLNHVWLIKMSHLIHLLLQIWILLLYIYIYIYTYIYIYIIYIIYIIYNIYIYCIYSWISLLWKQGQTDIRDTGDFSAKLKASWENIQRSYFSDGKCFSTLSQHLTLRRFEHP